MKHIAFLFLLAISVHLNGQDKSEYICPPCSNDCHNLVFNEAGLCPVCSMDLLNKANINDGLDYTRIYVEDVCKLVAQNSEILLLDVRSDGEYTGQTSDLGRLKNAVNIPIQDLEDRIAELERYKNSEIIVYCSISMRSPRASKYLTENGFSNVKNMLGGMTTWNSASIKNLPCKSSLLDVN